MRTSSNHKDLLGRPQAPWFFIDWLILIIGALIFLLLSIPFWINPEFRQGIDEGALVMQGKMMSEGYSLYDEIYSNQAPLGIFIFALLQGDFIATRLSSLLFGIAGLIGVGVLGRELTGRRGMILSMILVGGSRMFLRQSYMASIIMFSVTLTIWAAYFFFLYVKNVKRDHYLALSGFFLGLATMCKLFAGVVAFIAFLGLIVLLRAHPPGWALPRIVLFCIAGLIPLLLAIMIVDPVLMIQRTLLDQLGQPQTWSDIIPNFDAIKHFLDSDFSLLVFFSLIGMGATYSSKAGSTILVWLWGQLAFFAVYYPLWSQHLLYLTTPLALEATIGLLFLWDRLKALSETSKNETDLARALQTAIVIGIAFSSFVYFDNYATAVLAPRKPVVEVANRVRELTDYNEIILSGDPRVTVLADRLSPPWLADLARYRPKEVQLDDLIKACEDYTIRIIVLTYWLIEQDGFREYVTKNYSLDSAYSQSEVEIAMHYEIWVINPLQ